MGISQGQMLPDCTCVVFAVVGIIDNCMQIVKN